MSLGSALVPEVLMPIFGYYEGDKLIYVARTRNGFTPGSREALFKRFKGLETAQCPFANLPEAKSGRWGVGLTAAKMAECRWLKPVLVGQFEFLEFTPDNHLRHSRFVGLREDKKARDVGRESRQLIACSRCHAHRGRCRPSTLGPGLRCHA